MPVWLAERMTTLGTAITEAVVHHHGPSAFLTRLSDPFWFQAFGAVMGMDWHSSGITTSVMGALKRGINPRADALGLYICGGRGRHSRKTPDELRGIADRASFNEGALNADALVSTSRLTARIDNNAIVDGFQIYLHTFVLTRAGEWAVVQQGLNEETKTARRYHWHSASVRDFVIEPHTAIVGERAGVIQNLVDRHARPAQDAMLAVVRESPGKTLRDVRTLEMPRHHDVRAPDVDLKRLGAVLAVAHERDLRDFASLLLIENLGPRTLQSLALVAEVVHGAPTRFEDPARFSFAHGGKDGHPFPVPLQTYDETIAVLRRALDLAKVDRTEKLDGIKRLDRLLRLTEAHCQPEARFDEVLEHERRISPSIGGRTVFDEVSQRPRRPRQLDLW